MGRGPKKEGLNTITICIVIILASKEKLIMNRDPKEEGLNWGLDWSDYLTSKRDFIVARLEDFNIKFDQEQELGKDTVERAHAALR